MTMETIQVILSLLLFAMNLPMAIALAYGLTLHTDSTCENDIRDVKINKTALKVIVALDAVIGLTLAIITGL